MGKKVKLTIDGKSTKVCKGTNLITAAESVGIHIPNLCHVQGLKGIGSCRLCLVEIKGLKSPVTACTTKVKEGMVVYTQTEKVQSIRKCIIDLMLSMHPLDCMTCTKAGVCRLQQYAYDLGVRKSTFHEKKFDYPVDNGNPFIKRKPDYCILCGRCVRVCKNQGTSVLDFHGRGIEARVMTAADQPLQESGCTFCGSCLDACPVNALEEADRWRRGREWEYSKHPSICLFCGNACDTMVSFREGQVAKINAGGEQTTAQKYICAYGRFGFEYTQGERRIKSPLIRIGGGLTSTNWDEAFHTMADAFLSPHEVGFVTAGNLLNEDILTLKNFARASGIRSVLSTVHQYADAPSLLGNEGNMEEADLLVLVGLHMSQWDRTLPALDAIVRRLVSRGKTLIVMHSAQVPIAEAAHFSFIGDEADSLKNMARALIDAGCAAPQGLELGNTVLSQDMLKAAELYANAKHPVILSSPLFYEACRNIAFIKGDAISIPVEANAKGTLLMGVHGKNGGPSTYSPEGKRVLFVAGDVPLDRPKETAYLIVAASHRTTLAMEADLVVPITTSFETQGTIVDYLGRLRTLKKALKPFGRSKPLRHILEGAAKAMSLDLKAANMTDVKKEIASSTFSMKPSPFAAREDLAFNPETFIPAANAPMIQYSKLSSLVSEMTGREKA